MLHFTPCFVTYNNILPLVLRLEALNPPPGPAIPELIPETTGGGDSNNSDDDDDNDDDNAIPGPRFEARVELAATTGT